MLSIKLIGKIEIILNKENITEKFGTKTLALLSLLLLNDKKFLNREKIITYLWPDSNENSGKYNLRFNLWLIKNLIEKDEKGNEFLNVERSTCSINNNYNFDCDIIDIKYLDISKANSIKDLELLKDKFTGDFMEGFYFRNCDEFNDIIIYERNYFENLKIKILLKLVTLYENNKSFEDCNRILTELIKLEPYDEDIALRMMEIYEKWGKRSSAIIFYDNFKNKIMTYLGIQPSELLKEKYMKLKKEESSSNINEVVKEKLEEKRESFIIEVDTFCITEIKYFWLSNFLENLLGQKKININEYLTEKQIIDLSYILSEWKDELLNLVPPDVRIIKAFLSLIRKLSMNYHIIVKIENFERIDKFSSDILDYMLKNKLLFIKK